jgi:hypothetical protein
MGVLHKLLFQALYLAVGLSAFGLMIAASALAEGQEGEETADANKNVYPPLAEKLLSGKVSDLKRALVVEGQNPNQTIIVRDGGGAFKTEPVTVMAFFTPTYEIDRTAKRLKLLLKHGADPNAASVAKDGTLVPLLHRAVALDIPEAVFALLAAGANPDVQVDEKTAEDLARDKRSDTMQLIFQQHR